MGRPLTSQKQRAVYRRRREEWSRNLPRVTFTVKDVGIRLTVSQVLSTSPLTRWRGGVDG